MKAYLFGWNPIKFEWDDLDDDIAKLQAGHNLKKTGAAPAPQSHPARRQGVHRARRTRT